MRCLAAVLLFLAIALGEKTFDSRDRDFNTIGIQKRLSPWAQKYIEGRRASLQEEVLTYVPKPYTDDVLLKQEEPCVGHSYTFRLFRNDDECDMVDFKMRHSMRDIIVGNVTASFRTIKREIGNQETHIADASSNSDSDSHRLSTSKGINAGVSYGASAGLPGGIASVNANVNLGVNYQEDDDKTSTKSKGTESTRSRFCPAWHECSEYVVTWVVDFTSVITQEPIIRCNKEIRPCENPDWEWNLNCDQFVDFSDRHCPDYKKSKSTRIKRSIVLEDEGRKAIQDVLRDDKDLRPQFDRCQDGLTVLDNGELFDVKTGQFFDANKNLIKKAENSPPPAITKDQCVVEPEPDEPANTINGDDASIGRQSGISDMHEIGSDENEGDEDQDSSDGVSDIQSLHPQAADDDGSDQEDSAIILDDNQLYNYYETDEGPNTDQEDILLMPSRDYDSNEPYLPSNPRVQYVTSRHNDKNNLGDEYTNTNQFLGYTSPDRTNVNDNYGRKDVDDQDSARAYVNLPAHQQRAYTQPPQPQGPRLSHDNFAPQQYSHQANLLQDDYAPNIPPDEYYSQIEDASQFGSRSSKVLPVLDPAAMSPQSFDKQQSPPEFYDPYASEQQEVDDVESYSELAPPKYYLSPGDSGRLPRETYPQAPFSNHPATREPPPSIYDEQTLEENDLSQASIYNEQATRENYLPRHTLHPKESYTRSSMYGSQEPEENNLPQPPMYLKQRPEENYPSPPNVYSQENYAPSWTYGEQTSQEDETPRALMSSERAPEENHPPRPPEYFQENYQEQYPHPGVHPRPESLADYQLWHPIVENPRQQPAYSPDQINRNGDLIEQDNEYGSNSLPKQAHVSAHDVTYTQRNNQDAQSHVQPFHTSPDDQDGEDDRDSQSPHQSFHTRPDDQRAQDHLDSQVHVRPLQATSHRTNDDEGSRIPTQPPHVSSDNQIVEHDQGSQTHTRPVDTGPEFQSVKGNQFSQVPTQSPDTSPDNEVVSDDQVSKALVQPKPTNPQVQGHSAAAELRQKAQFGATGVQPVLRGPKSAVPTTQDGPILPQGDESASEISAPKGHDEDIDDEGIDDQGIDDQGVDDQGIADQGVDDQGVDDQGVDDQGVNDQGVDDQGVNEVNFLDNAHRRPGKNNSMHNAAPISATQQEQEAKENEVIADDDESRQDDMEEEDYVEEDTTEEDDTEQEDSITGDYTEQEDRMEDEMQQQPQQWHRTTVPTYDNVYREQSWNHGQQWKPLDPHKLQANDWAFNTPQDDHEDASEQDNRLYENENDGQNDQQKRPWQQKAGADVAESQASNQNDPEQDDQLGVDVEVPQYDRQSQPAQKNKQGADKSEGQETLDHERQANTIVQSHKPGQIKAKQRPYVQTQPLSQQQQQKQQKQRQQHVNPGKTISDEHAKQEQAANGNILTEQQPKKALAQTDKLPTQKQADKPAVEQWSLATGEDELPVEKSNIPSEGFDGQNNEDDRQERQSGRTSSQQNNLPHQKQHPAPSMKSVRRPVAEMPTRPPAPSPPKLQVPAASVDNERVKSKRSTRGKIRIKADSSLQA